MKIEKKIKNIKEQKTSYQHIVTEQIFQEYKISRIIYLAFV